MVFEGVFGDELQEQEHGDVEGETEDCEFAAAVGVDKSAELGGQEGGEEERDEAEADGEGGHVECLAGVQREDLSNH